MKQPRVLPLTLLALVLSGCQGGVGRFPGTSFALSAPGGTSRADVATSPVVSSAVQRASAGGTVTVTFDAMLSAKARQLLSTLADVNQVTVTLTPASGAPQNQTIPKAALAGGQVTATFTGVAPGTATYSVLVYDATGKSIGATTGTATVTAGATATVTARLSLDVTLTPVPTAPAGAGGGSGGPVPTTGSVQANLTIVDGLVTLPLTLDHETHVGTGALNRIAPAPDGSFWGDYQTAGLIHFSSSGQVLGNFARGIGLDILGVAPDGQVVLKPFYALNSAAPVERLAPNGSVSSSFSGTNPSSSSEVDDTLAIASDGAAWFQDTHFSTTPKLYRMSATGDVSSTPLSPTVRAFYLEPDHMGGVCAHVQDYAAPADSRSMVVRYGPTGTALWATHVASNTYALGVSPNNHTWVLSAGARAGDYCLVELSETGAILGTHDLPSGLGDVGADTLDTGHVSRVLITQDGTMYIYYGGNFSASSTAYLVKVAADGTPVGAYYLPEVLQEQGKTVHETLDAAGQHLVLSGFLSSFASPVQYFYNLP